MCNGFRENLTNDINRFTLYAENIKLKIYSSNEIRIFNLIEKIYFEIRRTVLGSFYTVHGHCILPKWFNNRKIFGFWLH